MTIFENLKSYVRFLGYLRFDKPFADIISIVLSITVVCGVLGVFSTSLAYLVLEENITIHDQVQCISSIFAIALVIWVIVIFAFNKQQFFRVIEDVEKQIRICERKYGSAIYKKANVEFESFTTKMIIFVNGILAIGTATIPVIFTSYYNYYVLNMGEASFVTSDPSKYTLNFSISDEYLYFTRNWSISRFPFNWRTPINFIYLQIIWFVFHQASFSAYCSSTILYIGIGRFLLAFCADLKQTTKKLNIEIKKCAELSPRERLGLKMMFNDLIHFQCEIRQLSIRNLCDKCLLNLIKILTFSFSITKCFERLAHEISSTFQLYTGAVIFIGCLFWCTNLYELFVVCIIWILRKSRQT